MSLNHIRLLQICLEHLACTNCLGYGHEEVNKEQIEKLRRDGIVKLDIEIGVWTNPPPPKKCGKCNGSGLNCTKSQREMFLKLVDEHLKVKESDNENW